jgi:hypothetical protein
MRKLCTALIAAALAALALAATAVSRLFPNFSGYGRYASFVELPWKAESVRNILKLSTEKVIQINKSTQSTLFEIDNTVAKHLENPFLGNNCYVGHQELISNERALLAATGGGREANPNSSGASVERSNQAEALHELSQLKNHLA